MLDVMGPAERCCSERRVFTRYCDASKQGSAATALSLTVGDHTACMRAPCWPTGQREGDVSDARLHHGSVSMKRWNFC